MTTENPHFKEHFYDFKYNRNGRSNFYTNTNFQIIYRNHLKVIPNEPKNQNEALNFTFFTIYSTNGLAY